MQNHASNLSQQKIEATSALWNSVIFLYLEEKLQIVLQFVVLSFANDTTGEFFMSWKCFWHFPFADRLTRSLTYESFQFVYKIQVGAIILEQIDLPQERMTSSLAYQHVFWNWQQ